MITQQMDQFQNKLLMFSLTNSIVSNLKVFVRYKLLMSNEWPHYVILLRHRNISLYFSIARAVEEDGRGEVVCHPCILLNNVCNGCSSCQATRT